MSFGDIIRCFLFGFEPLRRTSEVSRFRVISGGFWIHSEAIGPGVVPLGFSRWFLFGLEVEPLG